MRSSPFLVALSLVTALTVLTAARADGIFTTELADYYGPTTQAACLARAIATGRKLEADHRISKFVNAQCSGAYTHFGISISYWAPHALDTWTPDIFDRHHGWYRMRPYGTAAECESALGRETKLFEDAGGEAPLFAYCKESDDEKPRFTPILVGLASWESKVHFQGNWIGLWLSQDYTPLAAANAIATKLAAQPGTKVATVSIYRSDYWWDRLEIRLYRPEPLEINNLLVDTSSLPRCEWYRREFEKVFARDPDVLFSHCGRNSLTGYGFEAVVDAKWFDRFNFDTYPAEYPTEAQCFGALPDIREQYESIGKTTVAASFCQLFWRGEPVQYYYRPVVVSGKVGGLPTD